ncbi:alpha/beta hydrolase [Gimesia sp.]|uniref:alpha/beta hydrolase n=1 Tax=Gimesia sp. TaxID=2024833 RepID=UPI003A924E27
MDFTQRLKWIEQVLNAEQTENLHSPAENRFLGMQENAELQVNLPLKHISLFRPEHYEPGYAYPLVIWLHADGGSEHDLHQIMPQISLRNYLGLSFRAPAIDPAVPENGYHWPDSHLFTAQFMESIQKTILELRKVLNIHEDRIYLAGTGSGCSIATKLLLKAPRLFAGAALLNGSFSDKDFQKTSGTSLKGNRVLLDRRSSNHADSKHSAQWLSRMWETTGADIQTVNSLKPEATQDIELFRILDRWIMEGISTAWLV